MKPAVVSRFTRDNQTDLRRQRSIMRTTQDTVRYALGLFDSAPIVRVRWGLESLYAWQRTDGSVGACSDLFTSRAFWQCLAWEVSHASDAMHEGPKQA